MYNIYMLSESGTANAHGQHFLSGDPGNKTLQKVHARKDNTFYMVIQKFSPPYLGLLKRLRPRKSEIRNAGSPGGDCSEIFVRIPYRLCTRSQSKDNSNMDNSE